MCLFVGIKSHKILRISRQNNLPGCNVPNSKKYHMYEAMIYKMMIPKKYTFKLAFSC